jgi:hypothetical protein
MEHPFMRVTTYVMVKSELFQATEQRRYWMARGWRRHGHLEHYVWARLFNKTNWHSLFFSLSLIFIYTGTTLQVTISVAAVSL